MTAGDLTKVCARCQVEQPTDNFRKVPKGLHKRHSYCRPCHREYDREIYHRNPSRARANSRKQYEEKGRAQNKWSRLRNVWGLSPEDFHLILSAQNYACAICRGKFKDARDQHVDHCHATGIIRGLLCQRCNNGLGFFRDSTALMRRAARYVDATTR